MVSGMIIKAKNGSNRCRHATAQCSNTVRVCRRSIDTTTKISLDQGRQHGPIAHQRGAEQQAGVWVGLQQLQGALHQGHRLARACRGKGVLDHRQWSVLHETRDTVFVPADAS